MSAIRYYVKRLNDKIVNKIFRLCLKTLVFVHRYTNASYFNIQLGNYNPPKTTIAVIAESNEQFRYFSRKALTPEKFTHVRGCQDVCGRRFSEYLIVGSAARHSHDFIELTNLIKANLVRCY